MYSIQICFADDWTSVASGYPTRNDAEWEIAIWKQKNHCYGDTCFRTIHVPDDPSDSVLTRP